MQATRGEILSVVSHDAEKRVIRLKNATFEIPDDDPDDVGVDQASDLRLALFEIAVELDVFLDRFPPPFRFEPRKRERRPGYNGDNDDRADDEPCLALLDFVGAPQPIHKQKALVVHHLVDLRSDLVRVGDVSQRRIQPGGASRLDDVIHLAELCCDGQHQMCGTKALQRIVRNETLQRLTLPTCAFVRDAVRLEIGRVEGKQIAAPFGLQVGDGRPQPIEHIDHLPTVPDPKICRLPIVPISEPEIRARSKQHQEQRDRQDQRASKPARGQASSREWHYLGSSMRP